MWAKYLSKILWSYHITLRSTTRETPLRMVYGEDAMIPVEINTPTWRRENFDKESNKNDLISSADMVEEIREMAQVREFVVKSRVAKKLNLKVKQ